MKTMLKINATLRTLLLNVSDAINEHDAKIGYALRAAVSGRTIGHQVEVASDDVSRLLKNAMGLSADTDAMVHRAIGNLAATV